MKEALSVADKVANHDLYIKLVGLTDQIVTMSDENSKLKQENRQLQELLDQKASMVFEFPCYYTEDDRTPFCAHCWDTEKIAVHLQGPFTRSIAGPLMECPKCKTLVYVDWARDRSPKFKEFLDEKNIKKWSIANCV